MRDYFQERHIELMIDTYNKLNPDHKITTYIEYVKIRGYNIHERINHRAWLKSRPNHMKPIKDRIYFDKTYTPNNS